MLRTPSLFGAFATLKPDGAVLLASAGLILLFWELNRPGSILPGALGVLCFLLAASSLAHYAFGPGALLLLVLSTATLCANLRYELPVWMLVAATASLTCSLRFLVRPFAQLRVHTPVALACGFLLGSLSSALSRIALRARRAKQVD